MWLTLDISSEWMLHCLLAVAPSVMSSAFFLAARTILLRASGGTKLHYFLNFILWLTANPLNFP